MSLNAQVLEATLKFAKARMGSVGADDPTAQNFRNSFLDMLSVLIENYFNKYEHLANRILFESESTEVFNSVSDYQEVYQRLI